MDSSRELDQGGLRMRVVVDKNLCEANALCVENAPDVFALDTNEELEVTAGQVPHDAEDRVRTSIAQCPRAALSERE
ncbi:ferredoxin [Rhodococcus sp. WS3]